MAANILKAALNVKDKKNKISKFINSFNEVKDEFQDVVKKLNVKRGKGKKRTGTPGYNNITIGGQAFALSNLGTGSASMSLGPMGSQMIVEKTEPLMTITASSTAGAFGVQTEFCFPMNANFAWLQNMANAFSSYEVLAWEVTYVPSVPTTTTGSLSIAFYEDLVDDDPTTLAQMLVSEQALFAPVYAGGEGGRYLQKFGSPNGNIVSFMVPKHAICDALGAPKRFKVTKPTTITTITSNESELGRAALSDYIIGKVCVGTQGCTASQTVGQLFVRYKLRLSGTVSITNQK
jgi:hypothetical protein